MPYNIHLAEGSKIVQVVDFAGRLDALAAAQLKQDLDALLANEKYRLVVLMTRMEIVSAAGLNVILGYAQEARSHKGNVKIAGAIPVMRRVLSIAGFDSYFSFHETEEEAVKSFSSK
jgi:anti-anti-sigma factor